MESTRITDHRAEVVTHIVKTTLPMRHKISISLRNPQKQKGLNAMKNEPAHPISMRHASPPALVTMIFHKTTNHRHKISPPLRNPQKQKRFQPHE